MVSWMVAAWRTPYPNPRDDLKCGASWLEAVASAPSDEQSAVALHSKFKAHVTDLCRKMQHTHKKWAAGLEPAVRELIGDVRLDVLEELCREAKYHDHRLKVDISAGLLTVGDLEPTGAWTPISEGPPSKSIEEIQAEHHAAITSNTLNTTHTFRQELWDIMMQYVAEGRYQAGVELHTLKRGDISNLAFGKDRKCSSEHTQAMPSIGFAVFVSSVLQKIPPRILPIAQVGDA